MRNSLIPLTLISFLFTACATAQPTVEMQARVVDGDGNPIEGARVGIGFPGVTVTSGSGFWERTDSEGYATAIGEAPFGVMLTVQKKGYYESKVDRYHGDRDAHKWTREVMLREIKNPIPLYAKKVFDLLPTAGEKIGYDFERGDWVHPYGEGSTPHVLFEFDGHAKDFFNYEAKLKVSFPNPDDGLLPIRDPLRKTSELKMPHTAPSSGYQSFRVWRKSGSDRGAESKTMSTKDDSLSYFLRIQTERSDTDIRANYAKILGDIGIDPRVDHANIENKTGAAVISFKYYYNPTVNDRNLEFDIQRNLFDDLPDDEQVKSP